jgi:8-amino-7-oxononanoate synthase
LSANSFIKQKLAARRLDGSLRQLKLQSGLVDFCSNDYLGFARSAALKQLIADEVSQHPDMLNGSTGSRLLAGNLSYTEELEQLIAAYHQSDAGLIFNSGYDANLGLFSSLPQRGDTVIHDDLIHASIIDGIRLSHANRYSFKHNDLHSLEEKLQQAKGNCYVVVESIYSMDGDSARLKEITELIATYQNVHLIVDEAHATGVFSKGLVNQLHLENHVFARIITFGKALGCHGAIVLGSSLLRQFLINFARSFIYTTAAPFHQLATIKMAYKLLKESDNTISVLHDRIAFYNNSIGIHGDHKIHSDSAIQTVILHSNENAVNAATLLQQQGLDVRPILSPTVAAGTERLRICLHAYNTAEEITLLTQTIKQIIHAEG